MLASSTREVRTPQLSHNTFKKEKGKAQEIVEFGCRLYVISLMYIKHGCTGFCFVKAVCVSFQCTDKFTDLIRLKK